MFCAKRRNGALRCLTNGKLWWRSHSTHESLAAFYYFSYLCNVLFNHGPHRVPTRGKLISLCYSHKITTLFNGLHMRYLSIVPQAALTLTHRVGSHWAQSVWQGLCTPGDEEKVRILHADVSNSCLYSINLAWLSGSAACFAVSCTVLLANAQKSTVAGAAVGPGFS